MGTVPTGMGLARMMASRISGMFPPVERSITVSAPCARQSFSFSSSCAMSEVTAELPMFALILQVAAMPMPSGSSSGWQTLAGMTIRPRATSALINSAGSRSRAATLDISSVTVPCLARCIWETLARPRRFETHSDRMRDLHPPSGG